MNDPMMCPECHLPHVPFGGEPVCDCEPDIDESWDSEPLASEDEAGPLDPDHPDATGDGK